MKKSYVAPKINIEHYELTCAIAACSGLKIGLNDSACVFKDKDATDEMKGFAVSYAWFNQASEGGCYNFPDKSADVEDGICYHTNANIAFASV